MKLFVLLSLVLGCGLLGWQVSAMSSAGYKIDWDSVNTAGGNELSGSAAFKVNDTIGQTGAGSGASSNYQLQSGYRAATDPEGLSLVVNGRNGSYGQTYTNFSSVSKSVTVSSSPVATTGDTIAVVENVGFTSRVSVGRVVTVVGNVLTVDAWGGEPGLMSASPAGGDDFVYVLNAPTLSSFGTVTVGAQNTALSALSVVSPSVGYDVTVEANQTLRSDPSHAIPSVADGTVSNDADEYGVEEIGTHAYSPGTDVAVPTTQTTVLQSATPTSSSVDRVALLFKLGVTSAAQAGDYSQTLYFTLTGHF